jgi:very-short-patch-repair endonuclease
VDHVLLRTLLRHRIGALKDRGTEKELPGICAQLGLPSPVAGASKREQMLASFDAAPDQDIAMVAQRFIEYFSPEPSVRNQIQDVLWADHGGPEISKRHRREIAQTLHADDLYIDQKRFDALLRSLWDIEDGSMGGFLPVQADSLAAGIERHVYRNPDWTPEEFFDRLGAFECSTRRFCLFLEGLVSSEVRPDEAQQRHLVSVLNDPLRRCGAELREIRQQHGYPVFSIVPLRNTPVGIAKNIIFASHLKPDLRFSDAVSNDIEIVTNFDGVLVYDRPLGQNGLRWDDLQAWWAAKQGGLQGEEAKNTLFKRLRECLPSNSPPQRFLFETFFRIFGPAVHHLPALLPEVWLHWDPKTVAERGAAALARFRMDFLMLLPYGVRVVLEVDGQQHFAEDTGRASPMRYASMMASDRDLRLAGYEVFRFGAAELDGSPEAKLIVKDFFEALFKLHHVRVTNERTSVPGP